MNGKESKIGVESSQFIKKEGFYKNDLGKYSNTVDNHVNRFLFYSWFASRYIKKAFFYIFPPARFLADALGGIEKLQTLGEKVVDKQGKEVTTQKQGVLQREDAGFSQLLKVIIKNTLLKGDYNNIILVEDSAGVRIGNSSDIIRFIVLKRGEEEERLTFHPFDPDKAIRDLRDWVGDYFREQLAYWMVGVLGIWLLANSYMLYLLNKP
jgi:hypothetical protein